MTNAQTVSGSTFAVYYRVRLLDGHGTEPVVPSYALFLQGVASLCRPVPGFSWRECSRWLSCWLRKAYVQQDQPPPDPTPPKGVQVLTRGPVHEAYAEPTETRPIPSLVVPKQPPEPINEIPPDEKPTGDDVVWIPGYWGWDEEQKDFIWVSGFWRVPPPNHQWVPGNWQQVENGWQWSAGFWATTSQEEIEYLPAPPPTLDVGASTPAPDDDNIYSPGCWIYRDQRYFWRPGFWVPFRPNWVWIPAHYIASPGGYIFVEGYWDYPLEQRGVLFAPVQIDPTVIGPDWTYSPQYVVQPDFLLGALFVRPDYCHYYFGDYFDPGDQESGFVPWIDYRPSRGSFDPNFAYYRQRFRGDGTWENNLRQLYAGRTSGDIARPPRTLGQQNMDVRNITANKTANERVHKDLNLSNIQNVSVVTPFSRMNNTRITNLASLGSSKSDVHKIEDHVIKMETVPKERKAEISKAVTAYRGTAQQREQVESKLLAEGHAPVKPSDPAQRVKMALPRTPTAGLPPGAERPKVPPGKEVPEQPTPPKQEERAIPPHNPPARAGAAEEGETAAAPGTTSPDFNAESAAAPGAFVSAARAACGDGTAAPGASASTAHACGGATSGASASTPCAACPEGTATSGASAPATPGACATPGAAAALASGSTASQAVGERQARATNVQDHQATIIRSISS